MKKIYLLILLLPLFANAQIITTIAGTGDTSFSGDGGPALAASFNNPVSLGSDKHGNLYLTDVYHNRIRKISTTGIVTTIGGTGIPGLPVMGPATASPLGYILGITVDTNDNVLFAHEHRLLKISPAGTLSRIAGTGVDGNGCDNCPATTTFLRDPRGVAVNSSGTIFLVDAIGYRIRRIELDGKIFTHAGNGMGGPYINNIPASTASVYAPWDGCMDKHGSLFFVDSGGNTIRKIGADGIIRHVCGGNGSGYSGDGGPATAAHFNGIQGVIVDKNDQIFIADGWNHCVRKIDKNGIITTIAGNGTAGFSGDGGPATAAKLNGPFGMAFDNNGNLYIADVNNNRIRKISGLYTAVSDPSQAPDKFTIYPNPARNELTITSQKKISTVTISDFSGRIIVTRSCNTDHVTINIAALPAGGYNVCVNNSYFEKIVKE